jgi:hypothetical protein
MARGPASKANRRAAAKVSNGRYNRRRRAETRAEGVTRPDFWDDTALEFAPTSRFLPDGGRNLLAFEWFWRFQERRVRTPSQTPEEEEARIQSWLREAGYEEYNNGRERSEREQEALREERAAMFARAR